MIKQTFLANVLVVACFPSFGKATGEADIESLRRLIDNQQQIIAKQARQIDGLAQRISSLEIRAPKPLDLEHGGDESLVAEVDMAETEAKSTQAEEISQDAQEKGKTCEESKASKSREAKTCCEA